MAPFFSWADGMLKWFSDWLRQRRARSIPVAASQWAAAESEVPALHGLPPSDRERLRRLVLQFLADKEWTGAAGLELTPHMQLVIALQACLPILNLGLDWYDDWRGIVVYPEEFAVNRRVTDDIGLVHEYEDHLMGEAWDNGPVVVSWFPVEHRPDNVNPVIHEFAHALDLHRGNADGMPRLHAGMSRADWAKDFGEAYADLCRRVDNGGETPLDPYATTAPAEFFAVASEVFFDAPEKLAHAYPKVYGQLSRFYRQDPLRRP